MRVYSLNRRPQGTKSSRPISIADRNTLTPRSKDAALCRFARRNDLVSNPRMQFVIEGLPESTHWRIYCRAVEHGRSVNDEILAILNAGNTEIAPDAETRLARRKAGMRRPSSVSRIHQEDSPRACSAPPHVWQPDDPLNDVRHRRTFCARGDESRYSQISGDPHAVLASPSRT
jgi:plasmid stability protein